MRINGKEYGLRLTVAAAIATEKVCPKTDITQIRDVLKGEDAAKNVIRIVRILSEGYADSEKHKGRAESPVTIEELIGACGADELFFSHMVEAIAETFARAYHGTIRSKPTKAGREAARKGAAGKRTLENTLPWYLYFGRNHGMNKEDVLYTTFGELQDLLTCDAITHGLADEVAPKKKLSQEEMLALE